MRVFYVDTGNGATVTGSVSSTQMSAKYMLTQMVTSPPRRE